MNIFRFRPRTSCRGTCTLPFAVEPARPASSQSWPEGNHRVRLFRSAQNRRNNKPVGSEFSLIQRMKTGGRPQSGLPETLSRHKSPPLATSLRSSGVLRTDPPLASPPHWAKLTVTNRGDARSTLNGQQSVVRFGAVKRGPNVRLRLLSTDPRSLDRDTWVSLREKYLRRWRSRQVLAPRQPFRKVTGLQP